jgi:dTDP-4-amino-4,6-dideoxygalactose transaminase
MSQLAILGGMPVRTKPFPVYNPIGEEEIAAANRVLRSGNLSGFLGCSGPAFLGGPEVQALEREWSAAFHVQHSVSMNSATSGLIAACKALNLGPCDEVVVTPYSMCISATAPLFCGATPVFADIDPETYNLTAETISAIISAKTAAIIVVHLFGQPADMDPILALAKEHNLKIIEDCAQAPGATYKGKPVGSIGDIGVFSLNQRKIITCGEGGVCTTDAPELAERLQRLRNHGEAVGADAPGYNFRLGEVEAAIARCQLRKLSDLNAQNKANVTYLEKQLSGIPGLLMPKADGDHVYFVHALALHAATAGASRGAFIAALKQEGVPVSAGYVRPLHLLPIFRYDKGTWPETLNPHAMAAHLHCVMTHDLIRPGLAEADLDDVARAFHKVSSNADDLTASGMAA